MEGKESGGRGLKRVGEENEREREREREREGERLTPADPSSV